MTAASHAPGSKPSRRTSRATDARRPPKIPALLLGIGLGGFVDGIVLHQLLQWHHLLTDEGDFPSDTVRGLEQNTFADGLFHVVTWLLVLVGTLAGVSAWQRRRLAPPWRGHIGLLLIGWGSFNLVEGLLAHHVLGVHHVRDDLGGPLSWDIGFLLSGVVLMFVGWALSRSGRSVVAEEPGWRP